MSTDIHMLEKLIAMHRHSLEALRKDVATLERLVQECREKLQQSQTTHDGFVEETRQAEAGAVPLIAAAMLERRRYIDYLQKNVDQAELTLGEAAEQERHAHKAFDDCHMEIRKLEKVAERRKKAMQQLAQRKAYAVADDLELVRTGRNWSANGAY